MAIVRFMVTFFLHHSLLYIDAAGKKRQMGTLESHKNGFLFTTIKGEKITILYNRIKHAFLQPAEGELEIKFHFHLKKGIMIGKKQYTDIQFYAEVGESSTDLSKRSNAYDKDEIEQEQRERAMRKKIHKTFITFFKNAEEMTQQSHTEDPSIPEIEFELPYQELKFQGVALKEISTIIPTTSALVSLAIYPSFVVSLDDIERVHFERVDFALKNFDIVFIFKDYARKTVMINTVRRRILFLAIAFGHFTKAFRISAFCCSTDRVCYF